MAAELGRPYATDLKAKGLAEGFWISEQFYQGDIECQYLWRRLSLGELHAELVEASGIAAQRDLLPPFPSGEETFEEVIRFTLDSETEEVWAWFRDSKLSRSDRNRLREWIEAC